MTKATTCTVIGRLIQEGWLAAVHDPAPAPLWRDPRSIHRLITLDHLLRMRSGLAFPVTHGDGGRVTLGFENSAVYQDASGAFAAAQRSIVATVPGAVYRYINSGLNVLGAIIRDQTERRGLLYHETLYGLLIDRLGMASYQHSADIAGNLIASGAGFAALRDYAKLGGCSTSRTAYGTATSCSRRAGPITRLPRRTPGLATRPASAPISTASSLPFRPMPPGRRARRTSASSSCAATA
jgi:CubicO group peptidase (beta-lactamase class C family)